MSDNFQILFSLDDEQQTDKHLVIINNSPIRSYHVLLVPDRQLEQPQVIKYKQYGKENKIYEFL